jgi:hypothetical protein
MFLGDRVAKYTQIGLLVLVVIVLTSWPFVETLIPGLRLETILGITIAALGWFFLYIDSKLNTAIRGPSHVITHMSLAESLNSLSQKYPLVKHMRIYALSTGHIYPIFAASTNINLEKCTILLKGFQGDELNNSNIRQYYNQTKFLINLWEKSKAGGRIGSLDIKFYFSLPTEYYVIFDNKAIIIGWYSPTMDQWCDVEDPIVVYASSQEGATLINNFIERFNKFKLLEDSLLHKKGQGSSTQRAPKTKLTTS